MAILDDIKEAVVDGETDEIQDLVQQAIDEGLEPGKIINEGLIGGMNVVAPLFRDGEMVVPEVMESADTMKAGIEVVKPLLGEGGVETKGKIAIGTVDGDLHDIGKNTARFSLEAEGYKVIDLGIDVVPEVFAKEVAEKRPKVLGISALLTTTVGEMPKIIKALEKAGVRDSVQVYVSGVPVTRELAERFGADHYCEDARDTVDYVNEVFARG